MKPGRTVLLFLMSLLMMNQWLLGGGMKHAPNKNTSSKLLTDTTTDFNVNNIRMTMRNSGQLIDAANGPGFEWPKNSFTQVIFTGGLWIGGKVNGALRIAAVQYDTSGFQPGTMKGGIAANRNNPAFRFYEIERTDTAGTPNYNSWPDSQGAPTVDGTPLRKGDQNIWCVYNDSRIAGREFRTPPLKVEVRQYVYGDTTTDDLNNTVYAEFKIINRDTLYSIDSAFISLWLDIDIGSNGGNTDDVSGVDTSLSLAYCYNGDTFDTEYGSTPPAVGVLVLRAPGGIPESSPHSFISYNPFDQYAGDSTEAYNYLKGLTREGNVIVDQATSLPTRFMYSGDPVANTGWVDTTAEDKVILFSYGPFSIASGDSTDFHTAIIVARGTDRLNSVTLLKQAVPVVQAHYNSKLVSVPGAGQLPAKFSLIQNYPNPFNPVTNFQFTISKLQFVSLKVYDVLGREVATLASQEFHPGKYHAAWDASNMPSGVYFYRLVSGQSSSVKKMILMR